MLKTTQEEEFPLQTTHHRQSKQRNEIASELGTKPLCSRHSVSWHTYFAMNLETNKDALQTNNYK